MERTKKMNKRKNILLGVLGAVVVASMVIVKNNLEVKPVSKLFDVGSVFVPTNNKYPAMFKLTNEGRAFCSATVLTKKLAITAAHCVLVQLPFGFTLNDKLAAQSLPAADGSTAATNVEVIDANPRADYALLKGDFSAFSTLVADDRPQSDILYHDYNLYTCGFPWGGTGVCYHITNPEKFVDQIKAKGQMIAGMSGGPVIDANTGIIYAVNTAVTDGYVVISPIINIFELLKGK